MIPSPSHKFDTPSVPKLSSHLQIWHVDGVTVFLNRIPTLHRDKDTRSIKGMAAMLIQNHVTPYAIFENDQIILGRIIIIGYYTIELLIVVLPTPVVTTLC